MPSRSLWYCLYWIPVGRYQQMLFAEALSQALAAGLEISTALLVAGDATPSRRFRSAIQQMATICRTGYSLEISLSKTRIAVGGELLAAFRVGEERGSLAEHLASYARRCHP